MLAAPALSEPAGEIGLSVPATGRAIDGLVRSGFAERLDDESRAALAHALSLIPAESSRRAPRLE